ncbi:MAG: FixH family protein [Alphaproteobacteria bacterium]
MSETSARKSLWIPWTFVAFFGVVAAVNAVMIWFAVTTFTGLDRDEPYVRGIGYNDVLEEERRQAALGWTAEVAASPDRLAVEVSDGLEQPLRGAAVDAQVTRPVNAELDFTTDLAAVEPGRYVAFVDWPAPGRWDVLVTIEQDGRYFQHHRRLVVR